MRMLVLSLGVTAHATSCILAVFLGGLALGAYLAGQLARRLKTRTLVAYGLVEIGVGVLAPLVSQLILFSPRLFVVLLASLPEGSFAVAVGRFVISASLLLPPTILMGASLPFLTRYLFEQKLSAPEFFSRLYGINTLGGVAGTLAACYVGFTYFGLSLTILLTAALNIVVGTAACLLSRLTPVASGSAEPPGLEQEQTLEGEREAARLKADFHKVKYRMLLCLLGGLTGFTAIGYEMLWTRMLRFSTTSTTYAFTAIVAMFLFGLALGSLLYNGWARKNPGLSIEQQLVKFAHVQFFSAISCGASLSCLPAAFLLRQTVPQLVGHFLPGNLIDPLFLFVVTAAYMFVPATLIGVSFPMIASICTALARDVSAAVGNVYASNTIGCVLGAAAVGLFAIPALGSFTSFQLMILGSALTGALAVWIADPVPRRKALLTGLPLCLAFLFLFCLRDPMPFFLAGLNLLKYGEDIAGTVMVLGWPDHKQLIMNGEGYSSTIMRGRRYMRLMGHLPVLLNTAPQNALVICFGMGTTAGAVALHPEVKKVDVVELSPLVLSSAGLFADTNYNVLSRAKVRAHIDDGRNFLLRSRDKFDVITLEPPPPTEAGIVNLYSKEFYELLQARLKPGGIACQWVPMACQSGTLWRGMVAAAVAVFEQVSLWESNNGEAVLICSDAPTRIDFEKLKERMSVPDVRRSMEDVGLGDPYALLASFVSTGPSLSRCLGGASPLTDDRPQVEFFLPFNDRTAFNFDLEPFSTEVSKMFLNGAGFDPTRMKASRKAMTLLRQATLARFQGRSAEASKILQESVQLLPENAYFKYAGGHSTQALE
jgi:spermidine synthase